MKTMNKESLFLQPNDPRWMDFIRTCPDANIFHHPAWMALMQDCYGYTSSILAVPDDQGNIRAGLPFMKVSSPLTGRRWVSLSFSDYCNPLYRDEAALEELTCQLVDAFQSHPSTKMEIRWRLPERKEIQQSSEFVLHTIQLDPDPLKVSKRFKRTHLQNIHTAEERGVTVRFGDQLEDLKEFYDLQLETRKRHGVPAQPWKYFENLWHHIVSAGMGFVLLAMHENETIAGMVYLGWGKTLIAKYAGSREDHFNLRPNNLLFWQGIRWGCEHGFEIFDMGRTEIENSGLRNFKSRWGAVEQPLYYSTLSSKPRKPSSGKLDQMMHTVIQRSPLWVCRVSGELLYKHVG
jgi:CelD/BcsL family acetyltransferase involved in cellulose biosynthesis